MKLYVKNNLTGKVHEVGTKLYDVVVFYKKEFQMVYFDNKSRLNSFVGDYSFVSKKGYLLSDDEITRIIKKYIK
jgi:hypothetical protein